MTVSWRHRIAGAAVVFVVVYLFALASGRTGNPIGFLGAVGAGALVVWFASDIGVLVQPAQWGLFRGFRSEATRGADQRANLLSSRLAELGEADSDPEAIWRLLVGLSDHRLYDHHGVDRRRNPDQARELMGDVLFDFTSDAHNARRLENPRFLSDVLTRIEAL